MSTTNSKPVAAGGPLPFDLAVDDLRASIRGRVIARTDQGYDEARSVWNATVDHAPVLIVQVRDVVDVQQAVRFVREQRLPISVRGGGHNVAGNAIVDDGVVIDLREMSNVTVDRTRRVAYVGGGATLGDVDRAVIAHGLVAPVGVVSATGIGGLALHGGLGFLTRRLGLTCDAIVGAEVVTAAGDIVHATEENHADLLWALRGGGGNFGVVTRLELALSIAPDPLWIGLVMYPVDMYRAVVRTFETVVHAAGDNLMGIAVFWTTPDDPELPEANRGVPCVAIACAWSGALDQGETVIRPLREIGTPLLDMSGPMPYLQAQRLFDPEYPDGQRHYWRSVFTDTISDELLDTLARHAATRPSPMTSIDLWTLGGAMARTPEHHGAFAHRQRPSMVAYEANWLDAADDEANIAWARAACAEVESLGGAGVYLNFPGTAADASAAVPVAFGANFHRLRHIKSVYDPDNVFRSTMNVPPGDEGGSAAVRGSVPSDSAEHA